MMNKIAFAALAVSFLNAVLPASGQNKTPWPGKPVADLSFTYSALHANATVGACGCFWMRGGTGEIAIPLWRQFSAVGEVSGERQHRLPGDPGVGLSLASAMGGVRVTVPYRERFGPFAQGVFGVVHGFDTYFPTATGPKGAASSFAMAAGQGMDLRVKKHLLVRLVQAEYQYMELPNNGVRPANQQHDIRLSAGLVLRFTH